MSSPIVPAPINNPLFYNVNVYEGALNILDMVSSAASLLKDEPRLPTQHVLGSITFIVLPEGTITRTMKKKAYRHLVMSSLISTAKFVSFVGLGIGFAIAGHSRAGTQSTKWILITAASYDVIAIALRVLANRQKSAIVRALSTATAAAACLGVALTNYTNDERIKIIMLSLVPAALITGMTLLAEGAHGETVKHMPLKVRDMAISPNGVNTPSANEAKEAQIHAIDIKNNQ